MLWQKDVIKNKIQMKPPNSITHTKKRENVSSEYVQRPYLKEEEEEEETRRKGKEEKKALKKYFVFYLYEGESQRRISGYTFYLDLFFFFLSFLFSSMAGEDYYNKEEDKSTMALKWNVIVLKILLDIYNDASNTTFEIWDSNDI